MRRPRCYMKDTGQKSIAVEYFQDGDAERFDTGLLWCDQHRRYLAIGRREIELCPIEL